MKMIKIPDIKIAVVANEKSVLEQIATEDIPWRCEAGNGYSETYYKTKPPCCIVKEANGRKILHIFNEDGSEDLYFI